MSIKSGMHPDRALTAVKVRNAKGPGRYADGNGLYLQVDKSGAKRWILRTVIRGRRCDLGLGSARLVSLADAREEARRLRAIARAGGNPKLERQRERQIIPTFAECAVRVHAELRPSWKNAKHADQWINTLRDYVFPKLGATPVDQIHTPDLLAVLAPLSREKHETARRVRQRIGTVFDWARASGFVDGTNPVEGLNKALPAPTNRPTHFKAMPVDEAPAFFARLVASDETPMSTLGLSFLILTAARTGEVIGATKEELDFENRLWTIPAERMKAGREHRVPLSAEAVRVAKRASALFPQEPYLFPGARAGRPLSNMAFSMLLRRMKVPVTAHGFRSTFRDWASERTAFPHEVCEMALAHTIKNKAEAAYRRGDLLEKRRELMEAWSRYLLRRLIPR